jgi:3-hydroxyisobutyrate dehydrogenase-like beta-hydroxyacid dehydrogenase
MAGRLLNAGHDVTVWNRPAEKTATLVKAGAKPAVSPRDVATAATIVFMCVTDAHAVEEIVFGGQGLAAAPGAGKLVVDFSSIHPDAARAIAARLKAANGMGRIDALVSGGTKGAVEDTLAVMAGSDAADIERVRPIRSDDGAKIYPYGPTGAGQTTKLCNQIIAGCAMAVLAEATRLAVNAGIDAGRLPEALRGFNPATALCAPHGAGHPLAAAWPYRDNSERLDTVVEVARDTSSAVPMTGLAAQLFRIAKSHSRRA